MTLLSWLPVTLLLMGSGEAVVFLSQIPGRKRLD